MASVNTLAEMQASRWVLFIGRVTPESSNAFAHSRTTGRPALGLGTTCAIETPAAAAPAASMYCCAPTNDRLDVGTKVPRLARRLLISAAAPDSVVLMMTSGLCSRSWSICASSTAWLRFNDSAAGGVPPCLAR
jgi:hypothetical protein